MGVAHTYMKMKKRLTEFYGRGYNKIVLFAYRAETARYA